MIWRRVASTMPRQMAVVCGTVSAKGRPSASSYARQPDTARAFVVSVNCG